MKKNLGISTMLIILVILFLVGGTACIKRDNNGLTDESTSVKSSDTVSEENKYDISVLLLLLYTL